MRAQSFTWPEITADTTVVNWGGHERTYAGKQTRAGEWQVTFTEVYSGEIIEGFKTWCNGFHDYKKGTISTFDKYATTILVNLLKPELYTPTPAGAVAKSIKLYRCWPTHVAGPDIDPNSSDPVELTVTFHYDYFLVGDEIETE